MTQKKIIEKLHVVFSDVEKTIQLFPEHEFFKRPVTNKWCAAEHAEHLFLAVRPLAGLFGKPETIAEKWGASNRDSRSYDTLVALYLEKIGAVGPGLPDYTPGAMTELKRELADKLKAINNLLLIRASLFTEQELDAYQVPHPVIGMLTCREFLYFTHYHTTRHGNTMKQLMSEGVS